MINTIYIEKEIANHPRTKVLIERFPNAAKITCERYTEIFNRKAQNFRLQKKNPALILAKKYKNMVLKAPNHYGIGAEHNYYFSHMLNCIYDCRYCFLQGMFQSAHYVLFINYEDFINEIKLILKKHNRENVHFFSGYDCDSLALDSISDFTKFFMPFFELNPSGLIELRTKSTQIRPLLRISPINNCVVAFSFTPNKISSTLEHKTSSVARRLEAIIELQKNGWQIGLRFDPLIYTKDFFIEYEELFDSIFSKINSKLLHSVSLGGFRLPKNYFRKIEKLYPDEILLTSPLTEKNNVLCYPDDIQDNMFSFCEKTIGQYVSPEKFFPCYEVI